MGNLKMGCNPRCRGPSIPDPPPHQARVGTPGGKKGGKKKSGRGEPKCCRRKRCSQREERAHQAGPGSPGPGRGENTEQGGREERRERCISVCIMSHLSILYPKLKAFGFLCYRTLLRTLIISQRLVHSREQWTQFLNLLNFIERNLFSYANFNCNP